METSCDGCRFLIAINREDFGECRRFPPQVVSAIVKHWENEHDDVELNHYYASSKAVINGTVFPIVNINESRCGEYKQFSDDEIAEFMKGEHHGD